MCGIAGIFSKTDHSHPEEIRVLLNKMLTTLQKRGPDAKGAWDNNKVYLGHTRLSIIDLSAQANQPMADDKGNILIFNGEIYNFIELKHQLSPDYKFKTQSDTEVILAAYQRWGTNCFHKFNGDWSIAIWDNQHQKLILSRDRFGIKPLYFLNNPNFFAFGSEVKALFPVQKNPRIDKDQFVERVLSRQNEQFNSTVIAGVFPLPPGHFLELSSEKFKIEEYYSDEMLLGTSPPSDEILATEEFMRLFSDSVKIRMRADVSLGLCLSGGMDSSSILAIMAKVSSKPIKTFSVIFPNTQYDESEFARAAASAFKSDHIELELTIDDFIENYEQFVIAQDAPQGGPSTLARYVLLKRASRDLKVTLDGQGGDEIFGGYEACFKIYRDIYQSKLGDLEVSVLPRRKTGMSGIASLKELGPLFAEHTGKYFKGRYSKGPSKEIKEPFLEKQYRLTKNNLLSLLHTEDRMTMAFSMEGRVPFLDHRLVEFCLACPVSFKIGKFDKKLLRKAMTNIPEFPQKICWRKDKKGFSTPFHEWLVKDRRGIQFVNDLLDTYCAKYPELFDKKVLLNLFAESRDDRADNSDRILLSLSAMIYLSHYSIKC